jgi:natural product biosynthesis luciferase-like monooxygenase protein
VDNISGGRVGISFASGWQPNDFVLQPEHYADRHDTMFRGIEIVRRLWRGETVRFPGPDQKEVEIRTLPRPVQEELPVWVTVAGNPETFRRAGAGGFRVLTHLLGQTVEQLAEKLAIYRTAWRESGHPGNGYVTLMLHTFVGDDDDQVREIVRGPMIGYLASALDLTEQAAWSFPTFRVRAAATGQTLSQMFAAQSLTPEEKSAILSHAFERYFETSGLFGTVESCLAMVDRLKGIGIDEVACLIDFGVASSTALEHLEHLNRLRERAGHVRAQPAGHSAIPALIARHQVTHLQCTPSMATLLTADRESRLALRGLRAMLVGGGTAVRITGADPGRARARGAGQHVRAHGNHGLVVHLHGHGQRDHDSHRTADRQYRAVHPGPPHAAGAGGNTGGPVHRREGRRARILEAARSHRRPIREQPLRGS